MPHTAEELAMLAFLRFARGAEPMSAAWRTLERNFLEEEIDLEALPLIETADLDDLVPASARRALDAALGRWLAGDAAARWRCRWRGAAADGARGARAARARQRPVAEAAKARAQEEEAPRRAKEAADKARAKEAEKRRRAAASAKAAEADAERSRAETARRDEAAAREAARTAAEVVVEEEDDDEAAVAERLEERLKEERLEERRAAVERSRREAQEARDRARRVERARREAAIARVLDLDDARKARYAAPEAACEAANDVLRATVELLSWDDFGRRGLLVRTRDGGLDWVDDDPEALRAGLERAVADLAEHAARATRAAAGCRAAAAELGSTFDGLRGASASPARGGPRGGGGCR
ncbi:hypothetical protein JL720_11352 [Aureococcus anophagefferens]|nr:hypothetical protein JL720_11352 [Aureococcus anophagefferens]